MNRTILIIAIAIIASIGVSAQKMKNDNTNDRRHDIDEKIALREPVDTFSILADKKDTKGQVLLFTANGNVTTYVNGAEVSNLTGRDKGRTKDGQPVISGMRHGVNESVGSIIAMNDRESI